MFWRFLIIGKVENCRTEKEKNYTKNTKRTIWTCFDKFKDLFFESIIQFRILNIIMELLRLSKNGWKKSWNYLRLTLNKGLLLWFLVIGNDKTLQIITKK